MANGELDLHFTYLLTWLAFLLLTITNGYVVITLLMSLSRGWNWNKKAV